MYSALPFKVAAAVDTFVKYGEKTCTTWVSALISLTIILIYMVKLIFILSS